MPNATVLPPATISVRVGSANPPVATAISYGGGGGGGVSQLKALTDVSMSGAQDRDVVTYVAATDSFVIAPAENSRLIIDNGFF
jgi:hypothetical protein